MGFVRDIKHYGNIIIESEMIGDDRKLLFPIGGFSSAITKEISSIFYFFQQNEKSKERETGKNGVKL